MRQTPVQLRSRFRWRATSSPLEQQLAAAPSAVAPEPFDYESIPAGYYDEIFKRQSGAQSKWHHLKFERVARELAGYRRVLDVGCGPGTMIGHLGERHDSVGIDLSPSQIDYARRTYGRPGSRFYASSPGQLPDDEEAFDAVTLIELIEHLDPAIVDDIIGEALERLRPGGKLILTTPNFRSAWPLVEALVNRFGAVSYDFQHINKFGPRRLADLLQSHGLMQVEVTPFLFLAPFAAGISWRFADLVARAEGRGADRRTGMLLLGTATKPG